MRPNLPTRTINLYEMADKFTGYEERRRDRCIAQETEEISFGLYSTGESLDAWLHRCKKGLLND